MRRSSLLILTAIVLPLCSCSSAQFRAVMSSPYAPAHYGVNVGTGQNFSGSQGTGVIVTVTTSWDNPYRQPVPVARVADTTARQAAAISP